VLNSAAAPYSLEQLYPQRDETRDEGWLDRMGTAVVGRLRRRLRSRPARIRRFVQLVETFEQPLQSLDDEALAQRVREVRRGLRRDGLSDTMVAQAFALIRLAGQRQLGMRHFDVQVMGGFVMLNAMVAEMQTGEGKTLTATLPACTAAMAGLPVHVITVNDYLVERDCELMRPIYHALGLSVSFVTTEMSQADKQVAYACDVVYCTNKTLVFDYLRDRILLASTASPLHLQIERVHGGQGTVRQLLLRGLHFAVVDEADSVLVDEARTPLIISAEVPSAEEAKLARQSLALAHRLEKGVDYLISMKDRRADLTRAGHERLEELSKPLGGVWSASLRRDEMVLQAITALHLFHRDEHYLVRDGKIEVIDEFTGRVMPDRSWSQGLHQLIETKEGCEITPRKEPLARISYQRFFRRYLHLSGMTGTAAEVTGELGAVFDLPVVRIPTHRPSRRVMRPDLIFRTEEEKWQAIGQEVQRLHELGLPVLLGTRSVVASETAAQILTERGLEFRVLNAKQDKAEAEVVASAGEEGRITIATNMAGRGTDIKLTEEVSERGGLQVILSERHEAGRIDRQLIGRCARQGDRGGAQAILSLRDALLLPYRTGIWAWLLSQVADRDDALGNWVRLRWVAAVQARIEREQSRVRKNLVRTDKQTDEVLSFSGRGE